LASTTRTIITHERRGLWARQLRPRFPSESIRWVETRSADDLRAALRGRSRPIVVLDLGDPLRRGLADLAEAREVAPDALIVVVEPRERPEAMALAPEMGATLVLPGVVVPPAMAELIARWIALANQRADAEGWSPDREPKPDLIDELIALAIAG
jgi:DNA-binding response OmpR family regulator